MDEFGYASQFPRVLRRFALFAIAFSIVSITTGIFVNYSYGITQLGPAAVWLWPVAAVGQLLVVLVLAELAGHMPLAGGTTSGPRAWWTRASAMSSERSGCSTAPSGCPGSRCSASPR